MIFRSQLATRSSRGEALPAFEAIAEIQHKATASQWFVTQPDHARISGELAAALDPRKVPNLSDFVVQAIGMHDAGWIQFDGDSSMPRTPHVLASGVALSFTNCEPEQFLPAWLGSIQAAQSTGPLGGLLVSEHFARLTCPYLENGKGTPGQRAMVEQFRERELARVERQSPQTGLKPEEIEALVGVLQFCDLVSLYWCANPEHPVELPQKINGSLVQLSYQGGCYRMSPSPLEGELMLEIPCLRSAGGKFERETVRVKVQ